MRDASSTDSEHAVDFDRFSVLPEARRTRHQKRKLMVRKFLR